MFGVRLSSLFTSRWMALLWAILVILTAIQFVGPGGSISDENRATSDGLTNEQRTNVADAF